MSGDYSRKTFKSRNNYSGVLMQQGRVQLDADWNEQNAIWSRRTRAETVDTIGRAIVPAETPDGFRIALNAGQLSIFPGRMYVDGLLAENHGAGVNEFYPVLEEERGLAPVLYQNQPFFPNANLIEELPTSDRHIAYLDVWQRELTYVKQPELVEPAIGVDTTARWQTVWQVKVLSLDPKTSSDLECGDQNDVWDELVAPSAGRLTTSIVEPQEEDNVCLVPTEGGYRALENRLYRVEVHDGGKFDIATFKWARHNASVETSVLEINGTEIVVAQSEWDGDRRFSFDGWVEVTDDVQELAGLPGEMRRVVDVDYATNTITLSSVLPAADFPTQATTNATMPDRHTRIKRWEQQNLVDLDTGLLPITGAPFYLEAGIQIEFGLDTAANLSGEFQSGDYWLFSARSADASIEILDRAPPRGIHHHYARLAILNFPNDQEDCRPHWPPEFSSGCCSVTVGDGETSHGQFTSIEEAVNQLPEKGGKVCVLPGRYKENVNILGKQNVTINGCGDRSIVTSNEDPKNASAPIFRIINCQGIRIESLSIEANSEGEGVLIDKEISVKNISLNDLSITAGGGCGIRCNSGDYIEITNNHIRMRDVLSEWPGIFVIADDVQVVNNHVETQPSLARGLDDVPARLLSNSGRGGIQIGGTSERVKIAGNTILRGRGDGITLGSLSLVNDQDIVLERVLAMIRVADDDCEPCSPPGIKIPPRIEIDDDGKPHPNPPTVVSAGDLYDIIIEGNKIEDMGRNGIGVVGFFDLDQSYGFIRVENLEISNNLIQRCLSSQLPSLEFKLEHGFGYGGIALNDTLNLIIHHNQILDNGLSHIYPICGIYVLHCEGAEFCDNRILDNGVKFTDDTREVRQGARSGIHLVYAVAPTDPIFPDPKQGGFPRQNGVPAAKIHNNIVSHPVGRALTINALGPVSISDNQFTSRGISQNSASTIASVVAIINLGGSNEFYQQISSFSQMANGNANLSTLKAGVDTGSLNSVRLKRAEQEGFRLGRFLANGNVMFVNNQVVLDELDSIQNVALSAIAIFSLDDITFNGNQVDCSLWRDFLIFPTFLFAPSVRVSDNRFKEGFVSALLSAVTVGLMNTTTDNQSSHCIIAIGFPGMRIFKDNIELWDVVLGSAPDSISCSTITENIGKAINLGKGI